MLPTTFYGNQKQPWTLVGSGILDPWIILKISHELFGWLDSQGNHRYSWQMILIMSGSFLHLIFWIFLGDEIRKKRMALWSFGWFGGTVVKILGEAQPAVHRSVFTLQGASDLGTTVAFMNQFRHRDPRDLGSISTSAMGNTEHKVTVSCFPSKFSENLWGIWRKNPTIVVFCKFPSFKKNWSSSNRFKLKTADIYMKICQKTSRYQSVNDIRIQHPQIVEGHFWSVGNLLQNHQSTGQIIIFHLA